MDFVRGQVENFPTKNFFRSEGDNWLKVDEWKKIETRLVPYPTMEHYNLTFFEKLKRDDPDYVMFREPANTIKVFFG